MRITVNMQNTWLRMGASKALGHPLPGSHILTVNPNPIH